MSKQIRLANTALSVAVDDDMYDELSQWDWYVFPYEDTFFAARDVLDEYGGCFVVLLHLQVTYPDDPYRWRAGGVTRAPGPLKLVPAPDTT